ncbi:MAG: hypothetical protein QNJ36_05775 [Calothrix sp. MO_167.B42]|nr:hypothetical protein [Calothrix sp. MO_167.B42]
MSAKSKILILVILSIFATVAAGLRFINHQPSTPIDTSKSAQQPNLPAAMPIRSVVARTKEEQYTNIPLENIKYSRQGTNPKVLAMNAFYNIKLKNKTHQIEVIYPQPNRALVTITQIRPIGDTDTIEVMKYRARLSTFGRSLLVSSPPLWQIVWAGYQKQCWYNPGQKDVKTISVSSTRCDNNLRGFKPESVRKRQGAGGREQRRKKI